MRDKLKKEIAAKIEELARLTESEMDSIGTAMCSTYDEDEADALYCQYADLEESLGVLNNMIELAGEM
jgi:vacuolar-type H+-ATPase subunit B/Vma2